MKNFRFGNHTDVGKVRAQNEDYMGYFENENGAFFVVCDGMGGHAGGAVAAQLAVNSIRSFFESKFRPNPEDAIYQAIQYANEQIYQRAQANPELRGMGTTCVLLMVRKGRVHYGHVGDSRIYLHRYGKILRLTKDHSFVQALVDQGLISEEEAETHPRRNELLRALGTNNFVDVSVAEESIKAIKNDQFLLCSDGLTGLVSDAGIEEILNADLDIQHKAIRLVELANTLGGYDNITVQLVHFLDEDTNYAEDTQAASQSNFNPPTQAKNYPQAKSSLKSKEPETIETISETRKRSKLDLDMVSVTRVNDFDYQPYLIRGFVILISLVFVYVLYQNTVGELKILGSSGDYRQDSIRALEIEARFYEYFWNANPKLRKVKDTYDQTRETIQEVNAYRRKAIQAIDKFFKNKRVQYVANEMKEKGQSVAELANQYRSEIDWILQANGVDNEADLARLDTLAIPLEPPRTEEEIEEEARDVRTDSVP